METDHMTVFVPGVRPLTQVEVSELPKLRVRLAEASNPKGVWLDVPCPEHTCLSGEDRISLPIRGALEKKTKREDGFLVEDVLF
jgi:hypothetical protein